jgi:hypothetical protein
MPLNRVPDYASYMMDLLEGSRSLQRIQPVYLGSSSGATGGSGAPPGGFVGKLAQKYVAFDTTESETLTSGSVTSLLDNLNHIRRRITNITTGSSGQYTYQGSQIVLTRVDLDSGSAASISFTVPAVPVKNIIIKGSVGSWANQSTVPMYMTVNGKTSGYYGAVWSNNTATSGSASEKLNAANFDVAINAGTSSGSFSQVEYTFSDCLNSYKLPAWMMQSSGMFSLTTTGHKMYSGEGYLNSTGSMTTVTFTTIGGFRQYSRMEFIGEF